ncbi:MAG: hypothetical protein AB4426_16790 [Xenococcaceae cyanobacterium]
MSKYLSIILMLVFLVTACGANTLANPAEICDSQTTTTSQLFCLIYQREQLMKNVAAYKYLQQQSSYVSTQELKVLKKTGVEAKSNGLPVTDVQLYSQILMDISKQIQEYWFAYWREHKQTPVAPSSLTQIRQHIQEIDSNIIVIFVQIRDNSPIRFKQQLENGIKKWLAQLDGIHPADEPELFTNMLVNALWPIVHSGRS